MAQQNREKTEVEKTFRTVKTDGLNVQKETKGKQEMMQRGEKEEDLREEGIRR